MDNKNKEVYNRISNEKMENASFILGIISITSCTFIYTGLICGALAIIIGFISKGGTTTVSSKAKTGIGLGCIGLGFTVILVIIAIAYIFIQYGSIDVFLEVYESRLNTH